MGLKIKNAKMEILDIKKILDINKNVALTPQEMATNLSVTFYPTENVNENVRKFTQELKNALQEIGVKIISFENVIAKISLPERLKLKGPFFTKFGKKIKKGIAIIVEGQSKTSNLAMARLLSLRENPIITIIPEPKEINKNSSYTEHMNASLNMFAYHMTNLAIIVNEKEWAVYSLNGSHPYFSRNENFKESVLNELIPKISAPVMPPSLKDFIVRQGVFNVNDKFYEPFINDLIEGGKFLEKTGLYPKKRLVSELNFRNNFYRWIGGKYLDNRNGMSYGFVARQLPVKLDKKIPDVWVLTSKSGSNKSNLNKSTDIIKMGLCDGKMILETPAGVNIEGDYKPSFDTRVILAHAVGNAILAKTMKEKRPDWQFYKTLENNGVAIAHWHGNLKKELLPKNFIVYGQNNPSVSCSSAQSAIYALNDKINSGLNYIEQNIEYASEIHIEPHHGINVIYKSLIDLANFLISNKEISKLE